MVFSRAHPTAVHLLSSENAQSEDEPLHQVHVVGGLGKRTGFFFIDVDGQGCPGFLNGTMAIDHSEIAGKCPSQMEGLQSHFC